LRNDAAGISFADASPHKRLARPPGADTGGVGAFFVSELCVCHKHINQASRIHNLRGIFADIDAIARPKVR